MPEGGVLAVFERRMLQAKAQYEKKNHRPLNGVIQLHPCTFTIGTKQKPHTTAAVECSPDYSPELDACPDDEALPWQFPSPMDLQRSKERGKNTPFAYLVRPLRAGPVNVQARGKILAVSAGYHAAFIIHSLEAHWVKVSVEDYAALRKRDVNGPNPSRSKAARMRSYLQLPKFIDPDSPDPDQDRKIVMMMAVVTDEFAWLLLDFDRLARIHIVTRGSHWTSEDLQPHNAVWGRVFDSKYGPDWFYQQPAAIAALKAWREEELRVHNEPLPPDEEDKKKKQTFLLVALTSNQLVFNGFGQHTANDILHLLAIHPLTPTWVLCESDLMFDSFAQRLQDVSSEWHSAKFFKCVACDVNSSNPFAYQYCMDAAYKATYVQVYRKIEACVRADLYPKLELPGLLNPDHTIGAPYTSPYGGTITKHIFVPVWIYTAGTKESKCYSVIQAQLPEEWGLSDVITKYPAEKDFRDAGKASTLRAISFHDKTVNMVHLEVGKKKNKVGRRKIEITGKRGRRRKEMTVAQLEAQRKKKALPTGDLCAKQARRAARAAQTSKRDPTENRVTRSASKRKEVLLSLDSNSPTKRVRMLSLSLEDF